MSGRHAVPGCPWWVLAGVRVWASFKVATFVAGLLLYVLLVTVFV